jgi:hypothetical protein
MMRRDGGSRAMVAAAHCSCLLRLLALSALCVLACASGRAPSLLTCHVNMPAFGVTFFLGRG